MRTLGVYALKLLCQRVYLLQRNLIDTIEKRVELVVGPPL